MATKAVPRCKPKDDVAALLGFLVWAMNENQVALHIAFSKWADGKGIRGKDKTRLETKMRMASAESRRVAGKDAKVIDLATAICGGNSSDATAALTNKTAEISHFSRI